MRSSKRTMPSVVSLIFLLLISTLVVLFSAAEPGSPTVPVANDVATPDENYILDANDGVIEVDPLMDVDKAECVVAEIATDGNNGMIGDEWREAYRDEALSDTNEDDEIEMVVEQLSNDEQPSNDAIEVDSSLAAKGNEATEKETTSGVLLESLMQEMSETNELIRLQNLKLQQLERLRIAMLSGQVTVPLHLPELQEQDAIFDHTAHSQAVLNKFKGQMDSMKKPSRDLNSDDQTVGLRNVQGGFRQRTAQIIHEGASLFDSYLVPRTQVDLNAIPSSVPGIESLVNVVAVHVLPLRLHQSITRKRRGGVMDQPYFVMSVLSNGTVQLDDADGFTVNSFSCFGGEDKDNGRHIKHAVIHPGNIEPFVTVADNFGRVDVFNFTIYVNEVRALGSGPILFNLTAAGKGTDLDQEGLTTFALGEGLDATIKVAVDLFGTPINPDDENVDSIDLSALAVYANRRSRMVLAGVSNKLYIFHHNGTLVTSQKFTHSINVLQTTGRDEVGISVGPRVAFFNMRRMVLDTSNECRGVAGSLIVSLSRDELKPLVMYAGTDAGEVLVLSRKRQQGSHGAKVLICSLVHKVGTQAIAAAIQPLTHPFSVAQFPVATASVRGYLLSVVGSSLVVHNITEQRAAPELLSVRDFSPSATINSKGTNITSIGVLATSLGPVRSQPPLIALWPTRITASSSLDKIVVFESLLPFDPPQYDMGWIRGPVIGGAVIMVIFWQYLKMTRKGRSQDNPLEDMKASLSGAFGASGGSRGGGMDSELKAMLSKMTSEQQGGRGMSGRAGGSRLGGGGLGGAEVLLNRRGRTGAKPGGQFGGGMRSSRGGGGMDFSKYGGGDDGVNFDVKRFTEDFDEAYDDAH